MGVEIVVNFNCDVVRITPSAAQARHFLEIVVRSGSEGGVSFIESSKERCRKSHWEEGLSAVRGGFR